MGPGGGVLRQRKDSIVQNTARMQLCDTSRAMDSVERQFELYGGIKHQFLVQCSHAFLSVDDS
jgi:hypothetical protein